MKLKMREAWGSRAIWRAMLKLWAASVPLTWVTSMGRGVHPLRWTVRRLRAWG